MSADASAWHMNNTFLGPAQVDTSFPTANDATQLTGTPNTSTSTWRTSTGTRRPRRQQLRVRAATATNQDTFTQGKQVLGLVSSVHSQTQLSALWALIAAGFAHRAAQVYSRSS